MKITKLTASLEEVIEYLTNAHDHNYYIAINTSDEITIAPAECYSSALDVSQRTIEHWLKDYRTSDPITMPNPCPSL